MRFAGRLTQRGSARCALIIDLDGAAPLFETPIASALPETLNFLTP